MITMILLGSAAAVAAVGTIVITARDGYRRVPSHAYAPTRVL